MFCRKKEDKMFMLSMCRLFLILTFTFFAVFFIGLNSSFFIKSFIKYVSLGLTIISFACLIVFFIKYKKINSELKKSRLMNILSIAYCCCAIICIFVFYGPFSGFREWLITKAMGSMTHQYLCKIFYSDEDINQVFANNYVKDTNENTNTKLVFSSIMYDSSKWNKYEKEMFENHNADEIYRLIKFDLRGQRVFLAVVYDPANLRVECSKNVMKRGELVVNMAKRTNALIAINGGRFYDPNHWSNGGIPTGVTIMNGKVISDREYNNPMGVIGITNDNVLVLYKNKKAQELVDLGVRDAVTSKPFLIVNGKTVEMKGNGGYGYEARTAIGQREDGIILLLVVEANDARTDGASMVELAEILSNYGAINAAALDGGTSSVMVQDGVLITDPINDPFVHETRKIATSFIVTKPNLVNEENVNEIVNSKIFSFYDTLVSEYTK